MKASRLYPFLFTAIFLFLSGLVVAQFPGGGSPPPGGSPSCWPPPCVPIDGGLGLLLAAGLAVGSKKLLDLRTKK